MHKIETYLSNINASRIFHRKCEYSFPLSLKHAEGVRQAVIVKIYLVHSTNRVKELH